MSKKKTEKKCWLCNEENPDTEIIVECEIPHGKHCKPQKVPVHLGCYMDIDA